jgi:hypothetical protein
MARRRLLLLWFSVTSYASLPGIPKFYVHAISHSTPSLLSCQEEIGECPVSSSPVSIPHPVSSLLKFRGGFNFYDSSTLLILTGNSVLNNLPFWKDLTRSMTPLTFKILLQVLIPSCSLEAK